MQRPSVLPSKVVADGSLLLRCWREEDVESLSQAIAESAEHLRPWMEWIADEPLAAHARRRQIAEWESRRLQGGDAVYGIHRAGRIVGGCGLHRRLGPHGLEIGYWLHPSFIGQGVASGATAALTTAAFTIPEVGFVEVHHDRANDASGRVPRRLGFVLVEEVADAPAAPAEIGIECRWRMTRDHWRRQRPQRG